MRDAYIVKRAESGDFDSVFSLVGEIALEPDSAWGEDYPSRELIAEDIAAGSMYCAFSAGKLCAFAVLWTGDIDFSTLAGWTPAKSPCYIERVGVRRSERRRGLAALLVSRLCAEAAGSGCDFARLLVHEGNLAAIKLYEKLGFVPAGRTFMFCADWLMYERKL